MKIILVVDDEKNTRVLFRDELEDAGYEVDVAESGIETIKAETVFGARLMNTDMIHAHPLIGTAFHRRFRD
jgi:CheY-like chemotaxis protein